MRCQYGVASHSREVAGSEFHDIGWIDGRLELTFGAHDLVPGWTRLQSPFVVFGRTVLFVADNVFVGGPGRLAVRRVEQKYDRRQSRHAAHHQSDHWMHSLSEEKAGLWAWLMVSG